MRPWRASASTHDFGTFSNSAAPSASISGVGGIAGSLTTTTPSSARISRTTAARRRSRSSSASARPLGASCRPSVPRRAPAAPRRRRGPRRRAGRHRRAGRLEGSHVGGARGGSRLPALPRQPGAVGAERRRHMTASPVHGGPVLDHPREISHEEGASAVVATAGRLGGAHLEPTAAAPKHVGRVGRRSRLAALPPYKLVGEVGLLGGLDGDGFALLRVGEERPKICARDPLCVVL
jgi:hypothetical protein